MLLPLSTMETNEDKIITIRELSLSLSKLDKEILVLLDTLNTKRSTYYEKLDKKRKLERELVKNEH